MADHERAESFGDATERGRSRVGGARTDAGSDALNNPPVLRGTDLDQAVMRSLKLATKDAHLVAYRTGTGVVTRRNGEVVVVAPDPGMYEDLIPPPFREGDRS